eukprot:2260622-Amphidinium_carterae.1
MDELLVELEWGSASESFPLFDLPDMASSWWGQLYLDGSAVCSCKIDASIKFLCVLLAKLEFF